jgi:hypothetical protein
MVQQRTCGSSSNMFYSKVSTLAAAWGASVPLRLVQQRTCSWRWQQQQQQQEA